MTSKAMPRLRGRVAAIIGIVICSYALHAQVDPGVRDEPTSLTAARGGSPGAGRPLPGLTPTQLALFTSAKEVFEEVGSVSGTIPGQGGKGLGPSFNHNSCAACHAFPAIGGSSPRVNTQLAVAADQGARNIVPSFLSIDGPIREARFKRKPDGSPDGGVHALFTIAGRADAPSNCGLRQTNWASQPASNLSFRIPTPTFGLGLVEAISDETILANRAANTAAKNMFGITGKENRNDNDGTITRFGWKAQNKSLLIFAGEAYNVEQGVTNEAFPNPRETAAGCDALGHPEDNTFNENEPGGDLVPFALFMKLLSAPTPVASYGTVTAYSIARGRQFFSQVGCVYCHTESMRTGPANIAALTNQPVNLFSDLLVHNMGAGLADEISQGRAGGNEFRTAPLWGLGQRIFLLHDGRTKSLLEAIRQHVSPATNAVRASEANTSVDFFNRLSVPGKQDLLNFLRSL